MKIVDILKLHEIAIVNVVSHDEEESKRRHEVREKTASKLRAEIAQEFIGMLKHGVTEHGTIFYGTTTKEYEQLKQKYGVK